MNKNLKNKLSISFILISIVLLSTLIGLASYVSAELDVSGSQSYSEGTGHPAPGYITVNDLWSRYDILCSAHGVHLPSYNNTILNTEKGSISEAYLTQNDISKILNISQVAYSYYELGKRSIPIEILSKLADYYNTSVDYLIYRTDEKKPYKKK